MSFIGKILKGVVKVGGKLIKKIFKGGASKAAKAAKKAAQNAEFPDIGTAKGAPESSAKAQKVAFDWSREARDALDDRKWYEKPMTWVLIGAGVIITVLIVVMMGGKRR